MYSIIHLVEAEQALYHWGDETDVLSFVTLSLILH
jgi:hypothetical protein